MPRDFQAIIADIIQMSKEVCKDTRLKPWNLSSIADEIDVSGATMSRIVIQGVEPKHSKGEAILDIHKKTEREFKRITK